MLANKFNIAHPAHAGCRYSVATAYRFSLCAAVIEASAFRRRRQYALYGILIEGCSCSEPNFFRVILWQIYVRIVVNFYSLISPSLQALPPLNSRIITDDSDSAPSAIVCSARRRREISNTLKLEFRRRRRR